MPFVDAVDDFLDKCRPAIFGEKRSFDSLSVSECYSCLATAHADVRLLRGDEEN